MGIAERKEREKQEKRDLIVDAAARIFAEEGYERTSMRGIAERIEYSPATIYLYFKDKDELLHAVHELGFGLLMKEMSKVAAVADPLERLRLISLEYVRFCFEHPQYYNLMFNSLEPLNYYEDHCNWDTGRKAFDFLQYAIEDCMQKGLIVEQEPKALTFFCWSFVHGMVSLYTRNRLRALDLSDEESRALIFTGVNTWLDLMKK
ncbi:MAG: TetR/AcrR family transcriptional regulator [Saprospiraceae bacterium]|nr:TetR/AcrR family transcriptional regulator [Saprospiraceae bacterium]